uniref:Premature ovarian failure, 1B n=2 Tax=Nothobranchius TaxID=28779 RepID=A0A1A8KIE3_NOTKU
MSTQTNHKTTTHTYRTVNVTSGEPLGTKVFTTRPMSPAPLSPLTQVSTLPYNAVNGYDSVRYLVPVQQALPQQPMVLMQQPMMMQQPMVIQQPMTIQQPLTQQVYYHTLPRVSVSSQESDELFHQQNNIQSISRQSVSSVFSHPSSPSKSSPTRVEEVNILESEEEEEVVDEEVEEDDDDVDNGSVEIEEVEIVNVIQQKQSPISKTFSRIDLKETAMVPEPPKLDTRYFGELLADVYRKNCDIHSYISDHVSRIRGLKHQLDGNDKADKDEVEALIPKGATELTKQQMRYLLQTRLTADKSMRLLLSTFSSLREELLQMSEDLRRLESEKESLERDLSFKADQARQYDSLLETVRENSKQLQMSLKAAESSKRSLENQLSSSQSNNSNRDFKLKELEGRIRAMQKENELLKQKLEGQSSNATLQIKTEELSRQYSDQLSAMRNEKDQEIQRLRSQIARIQTEVTTTKTSSDESLRLKITELMTMLEQRETTIRRQEEQIRKLTLERTDSSKNVTKTIITKRYRNQYPILGLLSDDYQVTSPVKEAKTIVIERTGEMIKQE